MLANGGDGNDLGSAFVSVGPPEPCQGGLVTAYFTTQEIAQEVARTADTDLTVRMIPVTGDVSQDEAAIQTEIAAIHEVFAPDGIMEEPQEDQREDQRKDHRKRHRKDHRRAFVSNHMLAYTAPGALADFPLTREAPAVAVLAAKCNEGQPVGTERRADFTIYASGVRTRVNGYVFYKRISCSRWRISDVQMKPLQQPINSLWFRNFYYRSGAEYYEAGKQCWLLNAGSWTHFRPSWQIQAQGSAKVELVDAHPILGGVGASCYGGAGTSYTSAWFGLPGGTR